MIQRPGGSVGGGKGNDAGSRQLFTNLDHFGVGGGDFFDAGLLKQRGIVEAAYDLLLIRHGVNLAVQRYAVFGGIQQTEAASVPVRSARRPAAALS